MKSFFKVISIIFVFFNHSIIVDNDIYFSNGYNYSDKYLVLKIPSINFIRNIYYEDKVINNVDYNVMLVRGSNILKKRFIFAGHSGYGDNAYFNDLALLHIGDIIYVDINQERLFYEVVYIYFIFKDGSMDISDEDNMVYLVTCSLVYSGMQLVIVARGVV